MRSLTIILACTIAWAQPPAMPSWLAPFPGAATSPGRVTGLLVETSYTTAAKPEEILGHYTKLFAEANLPFAPNFDGLGTTIRAAAPECDLLLKIREQSSGTSVKISCAPKSATPEGTPVSGSGGTTNRTTQAHRRIEEIRQEQEEHSRQVHAEFEAKSRARVASMDRFDQPVKPKPLPHPLLWPGWLTSMEYGDTCRHPEPASESRDNSLHCKYTTSAPMSKLHQFYLDLIKSHGYTVTSSRITAGSTSTGVQQNSSGSIDSMRHIDDRPNGATEQIRVSYSRMYLNEPISVSIVLTAHPGM